MSAEYPIYYKQPIRWARFHAHNRPHLFFSFVIGISGPFLALTLTPLRRKFLYEDHVPVPFGYPIPNRPRDLNLKGYDD